MLFNPQMVQSAMKMFQQGMFNNHPLMQQFNQMTAGKSYEQQRETIINYGVSRGYKREDIEQFLNSQFNGMTSR